MIATAFTANIFAENKTIADILPSNFPTTYESAWTKGSDFLHLSDELFMLDNSTPVFAIDQVVTLDTDGNYYFIHELGGTFTFTMNNDTFTSIVVSGFESPFDGYNGTYTAPTPAITIADILPNDFPTEEENGWPCVLGLTMCRISDNLYFNFGAEFPVGTVLTKDGNNYKYNEPSGGYVLIFEMDSSGNLQKIHLNDVVDLGGMSLEFYPLGDRKTIAQLLPNDFPTDFTSGWIKDTDNSYKMYEDEGFFSCGLPTNVLLDCSGSNYSLNSSGYEVNFIMNNNQLESIQFINAPNPDDIGTFTPYRYLNSSVNIDVGSTSDFTFTVNAAYTTENDVTVKIDGVILSSDNYELSQGSTHVKLLGSYISGLSLGPHTITISVANYNDITQNFTVSSPSSGSGGSSSGYQIPNTGVKGITNNHSLLKLSSLSILALGTYLVIKKKKD